MSTDDIATRSRDEAIPDLIHEHGGTLYRIALRLCGNEEDAEDLLQETFLNAWKGWETFEGRAKPTTWLYTIAARACQRRQRPRAGEPEHIASLDELADRPGVHRGAPTGTDRSGEPTRTLDRHEAQRIVDRAIGQIPDPFRLPVVLKDIAGLSIAETAEILDAKPATVKTRIHRGRRVLRRALTTARSGGSQTRDPEDGPAPGGSCRALLEAQQEALDRGVPFPVPQSMIDERCRIMLTDAELAHHLCQSIAEGGLPDEVARRLREACMQSG